jgi:tetratricopeptide (TPR) repeat protein
MKAALHSDAFKGYAGQFVWLEVNVDDPHNAAFLANSVEAYPMLELIDPASERALRVWAGTATADQLVAFLDGKPDDAIVRGDGLFARGDGSGAAAAYEQAIAHAPSGPAHDHALEQLATALQIGPAAPCIARTAKDAPAMPREHPFVNVVVTGASCAAGAPELAGTADVVALEKLAHEALAVPAASEDDSYQLYEGLYALRIEANDRPGAKAIVDAYLDYVRHRPAPHNDDERMARDLALVRAATKTGEAAQAIPQLEASERALATDPDASLRLATLYVAVNRLDDAAAAATRGLARAPKPTQAARLHGMLASIEIKQHKLDDAKRDIDAGLDAAERINGAQSRAGTIAALQQQRAALPP